MRKEEGAQGGGGKRGGRGRNKQFKKEIKNTKKTQRMHLNQLMQEEQYRKEEAHVSNRHANTSLQTPSHLKWDPWKPRSVEVCRRLAVIDSVHAVMAIAVCKGERNKNKTKENNPSFANSCEMDIFVVKHPSPAIHLFQCRCQAVCVGE